MLKNATKKMTTSKTRTRNAFSYLFYKRTTHTTHTRHCLYLNGMRKKREKTYTHTHTLQPHSVTIYLGIFMCKHNKYKKTPQTRTKPVFVHSWAILCAFYCVSFSFLLSHNQRIEISIENETVNTQGYKIQLYRVRSFKSYFFGVPNEL